MAKAKKYQKDFFIKMNMQNPPKPEFKEWYVQKASNDSVPEFTVCGYEFTLDRRPKSFGITEGFSPDLNFRRAFLPDEGHYWVSRDFSGQELRIMANLSGEKTWIDAFLNNEDIHAATAVALWGEENYNKDARKKAKTINFALLYGTGPASLGEQLGITKIEAIKLIDTFFKKLKDINSYLEECRSIAVDTKEISNPYGRKRRLKSYFNSDGVFLNSGKRKSFNFPIQSMGAEITKLALISIYKGLITNENYKDKVYFMNTIHDEINLSVRKDIVNEVAFKMGELMEHRIRDLPVPIITGLELGNSMGLTWKFNQDKTTLELTPEYSPLDKEDNE